MTMEIWISSFLLNRSASLPQIGVVAVAVSRVAVTTQVNWVCEPLSAPMICGSAVETTVLDRSATNRTSSRPESASSVCRWDIGSASRSGRAGALIRAAFRGLGTTTRTVLAQCATFPMANYSAAYARIVEAGTVGLRERKKAATRQALHEAAVRLAARDGYDHDTVEAIADAAEVSRRTNSNYFSSKEEAFVHGDRERIRHLLDLVHDRPAREKP